MEVYIGDAESKEEDEGKRFAQQVTEEVPKVTKRVQDIRQQLDNPMIADADAADEKVIKFLSMQVSDFEKMKARSEAQEYQGILKLNVDEFELLEDVAADLNLKVRLWKDKMSGARFEIRFLAHPSMILT